MVPKKKVSGVASVIFVICFSLIMPYHGGYSNSLKKGKEISFVEVPEGIDIREQGGLEVLNEYCNNALISTEDENIELLKNFEELDSEKYTLEVRSWTEAGNNETDKNFIEFIKEDISLILKDYWWIIMIVSVTLIIFLDFIFWRKDDKRKTPRKGRLIKLNKDLHQEEYKEIEDEYKL